MVAISEYRLEEFKARLQKMSDEQLIRYGKAARYMSDPKNGSVNAVYVEQLKACKEEWRRRHPKV
jgi:hypothetical protein